MSDTRETALADPTSVVETWDRLCEAAGPNDTPTLAMAREIWALMDGESRFSLAVRAWDRGRSYAALAASPAPAPHRPQPIDDSADDRPEPMTLNKSGLTEAQLEEARLWAADDRLWTTQETVEFNLRTFARAILAASPALLEGRDHAVRQIDRWLDHRSSDKATTLVRVSELESMRSALLAWIWAASAAPAPRTPTLEQLQSIEWAGMNTSYDAECPACRYYAPGPHTADCWLAAAIHARETTAGEGTR